MKQPNMNIVAIGGGTKKAEMLKTAVDMSGDENPNVLLVPTASSSREKYTKLTTKAMNSFKDIDVETSLLHDYREAPSPTRIAHEIGRASVIYTIGGNTPIMMRKMRRHGTDSAIATAIMMGKVHAGSSAGALLPFEIGQSNVSPNPEHEEWDFEYLKLLGLVPGVLGVHANKRDGTPNGPRPDSRLEALQATFPMNVNRGYAIDEDAALVINGSAPYSVIRGRSDANVYKLHRDNNGVLSTEILE